MTPRVDSPLNAASFSPLFCKRIWERAAVFSVVGRMAENANSKISPFVFLLYVICRLGTH